MSMEETVHNWTIAIVVGIGLVVPLVEIAASKQSGNFMWKAATRSQSVPNHFESTRLGSQLAFRWAVTVSDVPAFPSVSEAAESQEIADLTPQFAFGDPVTVSPVEIRVDEVPLIIDSSASEELAKPRPPEIVVVE